MGLLPKIANLLRTASRAWLLLAASALVLLGVGCPESQDTETGDNQTTPTESPAPTVTTANPARPNGLRIDNLQDASAQPYQVQFVFSLRDNAGHAVVIPETDLASDVHANVWENGSPLDNIESPVFLRSSAALEMDVVLVLDFSQSNAELNGIGPMLEAAKSLLPLLKPTHRIALEEFHDRIPGNNHSVLLPFTFAGAATIPRIEKSLDDFAATVYHGFSTCWDASIEAMLLFGITRSPSKVRALVVFSDGKDMSSLAVPDVVTAAAIALGVRVFNVGTGPISPADEDRLQKMSNATGGKYYRVADSAALRSQFSRLVQDLVGNYKVSYITPKTIDFTTKISLTYRGVTTRNPIEQPVGILKIAGNDREGRLAITRGAETAGGQVQITVSATHIPRGISRLAFTAGTPGQTIAIRFIPDDESGLIAGWSAPIYDDQAGLWETSGQEPAFGSFGPLLQITISLPAPTPAGAPSAVIPFFLSNAIYEGGVHFTDGIKEHLNADGDLLLDNVPAPK